MAIGGSTAMTANTTAAPQRLRPATFRPDLLLN
jgi:hypothetical protein